jgi:hypothetical protein
MPLPIVMTDSYAAPVISDRANIEREIDFIAVLRPGARLPRRPTRNES